MVYKGSTLDANPRELAHDNICQLLANRTQLRREVIRKLADYSIDPAAVITAAAVQEIADCSLPTARRYKNLILAALENDIADLRHVKHPRPTKPTLDRVEAERLAAERVSRMDDVKQRLAAQGIIDSSPMDSEEVLRIIDRQIRKLDADASGSPQALKQLLQLKIDFQELQGMASEEPVDPRKVLGPGGLTNLQPVMVERFRLLLSHRREMLVFYEGMIDALAKAIEEDYANYQGNIAVDQVERLAQVLAGRSLEMQDTTLGVPTTKAAAPAETANV